MNRIALIYTVKSVLDTFVPQLQPYLPGDMKYHNLFDDFLASDPNETGTFSVENRNRLFNDIRNCEMTGAGLIVVTCSTLTPAVALIRPFISVPVIAIDDAMCSKAVTYGPRIRVVATARSTVEPTVTHIAQEAEKAGLKNVTIDPSYNDEAFAAMKKGDMKTHDTLVLNTVKEIKGYDVVVLAQASMAHLEKQAAAVCGLPVLSSPELCRKAIVAALSGNGTGGSSARI